MTVPCHWCGRELVIEDGERFHVIAPAGMACPGPIICDCGAALADPADEGCPWPEQHPSPE